MPASDNADRTCVGFKARGIAGPEGRVVTVPRSRRNSHNDGEGDQRR